MLCKSILRARGGSDTQMPCRQLREAMYSACKIIRGVRDPEIVRSGIYHDILENFGSSQR